MAERKKIQNKKKYISYNMAYFRVQKKMYLKLKYTLKYNYIFRSFSLTTVTGAFYRCCCCFFLILLCRCVLNQEMKQNIEIKRHSILLGLEVMRTINGKVNKLNTKSIEELFLS